MVQSVRCRFIDLASKLTTEVDANKGRLGNLDSCDGVYTVVLWAENESKEGKLCGFCNLCVLVLT